MYETILVMKSRKGGVVLLVAIGLALLFALLAGYFYLQTQNNVSSIRYPVSSIEDTVQNDEMTNWKTYTNIKYGYSFKYPAEMIVRSYDGPVPVENFSYIYVSTPDAIGEERITISSRLYQKKTSFEEVIQEVFDSLPYKQRTKSLVDGHQAFYIFTEKEEHKTYHVLIQQDDYNYKILSSNFIIPKLNSS